MIFRDQPDPTLTPRERARRARMAADPKARKPELYAPRGLEDNPHPMELEWSWFLDSLPTTTEDDPR